jgi:small-conductance mechanosensitive channel
VAPLQAQVSQLQNQVQQVQSKLDDAQRGGTSLAERNQALQQQIATLESKHTESKQTDNAGDQQISLPRDVRDRLGTAQAFVLASMTGNNAQLATVSGKDTPRFPGDARSLWFYPQAVTRDAVYLLVSSNQVSGAYEFSLIQAAGEYRVSGWRQVH